jgi:RNA polymerase sigma-70 factor, ECF subfamily
MSATIAIGQKAFYLNETTAAECFSNEVRTAAKEHQDSFEAVAYRITGDRELARDVVQEAYLTVLEAGKGFQGRSSLKTYLYRIVINASIDARKRRGRWSAIREMLGRIPKARCRNTYEIKDLTRKLFSGISPEFTVPLILAEVDGMTYREIAETLQVPVDCVRTRIFRCREKLRNKFKRLGLTL